MTFQLDDNHLFYSLIKQSWSLVKPQVIDPWIEISTPKPAIETKSLKTAKSSTPSTPSTTSTTSIKPNKTNENKLKRRSDGKEVDRGKNKKRKVTIENESKTQAMHVSTTDASTTDVSTTYATTTESKKESTKETSTNPTIKTTSSSFPLADYIQSFNCYRYEFRNWIGPVVVSIRKDMFTQLKFPLEQHLPPNFYFPRVLWNIISEYLPFREVVCQRLENYENRFYTQHDLLSSSLRDVFLLQIRFITKSMMNCQFITIRNRTFLYFEKMNELIMIDLHSGIAAHRNAWNDAAFASCESLHCKSRILPGYDEYQERVEIRSNRKKQSTNMTKNETVETINTTANTVDTINTIDPYNTEIPSIINTTSTTNTTNPPTTPIDLYFCKNHQSHRLLDSLNYANIEYIPTSLSLVQNASFHFCVDCRDEQCFHRIYVMTQYKHLDHKFEIKFDRVNCIQPIVGQRIFQQIIHSKYKVEFGVYKHWFVVIAFPDMLNYRRGGLKFYIGFLDLNHASNTPRTKTYNHNLTERIIDAPMIEPLNQENKNEDLYYGRAATVKILKTMIILNVNDFSQENVCPSRRRKYSTISLSKQTYIWKEEDIYGKGKTSMQNQLHRGTWAPIPNHIQSANVVSVPIRYLG